MSITHSRISSLESFDLLDAHFVHPILIIVEDSQKIRILDATARNEDHPTIDWPYEFDAKISSTVVYRRLLWILLKSGEIIVIDTTTGSKIKLACEELSNYKIQKLRTQEDKVILISNNGECLHAIFSSLKMEQDLTEGKEHVIAIDKYCCTELAPESHQLSNGLNVYTERGALIMKCPITQLHVVIGSDSKIQRLCAWGDLLIISDGTTMWVMDIKDFEIIFEFKEDGAIYYPLGTYENDFYYLLWDPMQVFICCARRDDNSSIRKLSSQETLELELQGIIDNISTSPAEPDQILSQLQPYFEKIEDLTYLVNAALQLCKQNIFYKSLLYFLQKRVVACSDDTLIQSLCDTMNKTDLLEYINLCENTAYENVNLFELSFVELCKTFLSNADFDLASMCWLKYSAVKLLIGPNDIMEIMNAIPHNIKINWLINWLRNFLPPLLDQNPFYIDLIVRWVTERVFLLEKSGHWPKIGLKFIEDIESVLETSFKTIALRPISMDNLEMLKSHMKNIMELKESHKINMLLGELSSQSPSEIALIMLRRCYTEDLEPFLQHYLPSYVARHSLELDDTLRSFIEVEAARSGGDIDGTRLKILLGSFCLYTNRLECFLQVLRVLDVPWNPIVLDLAMQAASSDVKDFTTTAADRVLVEEIQRELNYTKVKVILKKYKCSLECTDYLLVLNKIIAAPTVDLNDLRVITSVIPEYATHGSLLYLIRCLRDCETRSALEYFRDLSKREKKLMFKSISINYEQILISSSNDTTTERNYIDFLKGTGMLHETESNKIENMYYLKNIHGIKLSINDMYCDKINDLVNLVHTRNTEETDLIALLKHTSANHRVRNLVGPPLTAKTKQETDGNTDITSILSYFKDGNNSSVLLECHNVLTELVSICREERIHDVIKCLSVLNALVNDNITVKNLSTVWKFHYIFLPMASNFSMNDFIDFHITPHNDVTQELAIAYNRGDFLPMRIITSMIEDITTSGKDLPAELMQIRNKIYKQLLTKVVASGESDELLATNLLDVLSKGEEQEMWIIDMLRGQNESLTQNIISHLSHPAIRRLFSSYCLSQNTAPFSPQYILKTKFNFNLADLAIPNINEDTWDVKIILFLLLKQHPETSIERLIDLCHTLNISFDDGLSFQLVSLLTTWDLKYKILNNDLGRPEIHLENDESELLSRCLLLWEGISNKEFTKDILKDLWINGEVTLLGQVVSINTYYYEVYLCIYHLLFETPTEKEYYLLYFLKNYNRKSAPKQNEFELFSVKGTFPEIGHYRLPFHQFMREDKWDNLKTEITLETYELWLPAVTLLELDPDIQTARDMICSNAIKQTMTSRKKSKGTETEQKGSEPWRLTTREGPLLRAAHRCIKQIERMEWAAACLFYVFQGCTRGADQVAAAQLCYQFAQRWSAVQPGNRAVREMERLYFTRSTRHVLHKIEWACEEFVRLSAEPTQLIRALYAHPNLVEKISCYDINCAANEIADIHGINISAIRFEILENILEKPTGENENKTCFFLDNRDLITAKYILKATCPKMGAIYLYRIALDDRNDCNKYKKLRALQCLMSIIDSDTALKATHRERDSLWESLLELLYIVNLEHIGMPWIAATFVNSKVDALKQLLQTVGGNVEGLKLTAVLAGRFGTMQIIQKLLPHLLHAGLHDELIPLLIKMSHVPDINTYGAWQTVLLSPFQQADYPITERQIAKCLNRINLLPVCPGIRNEDLIEIWKNCVRCKCFGIGCLLLPYINTQSRQIFSDLQNIDRRSLIASLKNLKPETYLISGAMHVVESIASTSYGKTQKHN